MSHLPLVIAESLIGVYEREYSELCGNWIALEQKAQLAAGTSGVVLTGALAFLGGGFVEVPRFTLLAFPLIGISLLVSGVCSLKALWITDGTLPPPGEELRDIAWRLKSEDQTQWADSYEKIASHQRVVYWDQTCKDLFAAVNMKGIWVTRAQGWLLVTGVLVFVVVVALSMYGWMTTQ